MNERDSKPTTTDKAQRVKSNRAHENDYSTHHERLSTSKQPQLGHNTVYV